MPVLGALLLLVIALAYSTAAGSELEKLPVLMRQIADLSRQGKFADAVPLAKDMVATAEKAVGREHQFYATSLATLADLYGLQGNNEKAERLHYRTLQLREKTLGAEHADVATSLVSLANIYVATARFDDAETALENALRIRRKVLPEKDPNHGFTFVSLGRVKFIRLRIDEAGRLFERAFELFTEHLAADHIYVSVTLNNLAEVRKAQGRYEETEQLLRQALAINERKHGSDSHLVGPNLNNLADLYRLQGRYEDAETLMRRHLALVEAALGPEHVSVAASLNNLALTLTALGRADEAHSLLQRALSVQESALGGDHPDVASTLNNLADALAWLDRGDDARQLLQRAISIREAHFGPRHLALATNLDNLAILLSAQERYADAEPLLRRALAIRQAQLSDGHPQLAVSFNNLGVVLDNLGRRDEARAMHSRALEMREALLGAEHPNLATSLNNLAANRLDDGDWLNAHDLFQRSNTIWIRRRAARSGKGDTQDIEFKRHPDSFLGFIQASFELFEASEQAADGALSDAAFQALQWALRTGAADALAKMSVRIAAGSGPLSALLRQHQDLANKALALDTTLLAHLSKPSDARNTQAEKDLRRQIDETAALSRETGDELARRFPRYAALTNPAPLSIKQLRQLLLPNEAFYAIATTAAGGFAWVVTDKDARWVRVPLTRAEIREHVAALRCGLDGTAWAQRGALVGTAWAQRGEFECARLLAHAPSSASLTGPFDLIRAHKLYRALFGEVEDLIVGRKLLVVPSGALASLPFHVLVAEKPEEAFPDDVAGYAAAGWLAMRHAVAVLPSTSSLHALRSLSAKGGASEPFVGFGNPLLTGPTGKDRRAWTHQSCATAMAVDAGFERAAAPAGMLSVLRKTVAESVRRQHPLPETADELCRVARASGADESMIFLGAQASETTLRRLDAAGTLAQSRVVHFATHGLLAGETRSVTGSNAEPALILTPPAGASELDDGLLTASEIAELKLNADWVILSACNTAAGGSDGGETLSGLARAFFFAGARATLVSHWAVNSNATVKLVTQMFDHLAANPGADRAEALREAMIALMSQGGFNAHPTAWAPFVLVGEGAK